MPFRRCDAEVPGIRDTAIDRGSNDPDPAVRCGKFLCEPCRAVRGGVVDDDDFDLAQGLQQRGSHGFGQSALGIVCRYDDRDDRLSPMHARPRDIAASSYPSSSRLSCFAHARERRAPSASPASSLRNHATVRLTPSS